MALREVMREVQQLGTIDPAAQDALVNDLMKTDPELWPLMLQQFRATIAYRQRAAQPAIADSGSMPYGQVAQGSPAGQGPANPPYTQHPVAPGTPPAAAPSMAAVGTNPLGPNGGTPLAEQHQPGNPAPPWQTNPQQGVDGPLPLGVNRLPRPSHTVTSQPPASQTPATINQAGTPMPPAQLPASDRRADRPLAARNSIQPPGAVVAASYAPGDTESWRAHLAQAIKAIEAETDGQPRTTDDFNKHAQLRMLYMLAGRRNDAVEPIPMLNPALQEFWSKELFGLSTWLDNANTPDDTTRAAKTKPILEAASNRLGETAPLAIRNLTFCTQVIDFGCTTEFPKNEFTPDQEAVLYAEVENFASEDTPKGFHTALKTSYQIFDGAGRRVAEREFATIEEHCKSVRRDFFIANRIYLPKRIYPGKYVLQLTIEDVKSKKLGQSSVEFVIVEK